MSTQIASILDLIRNEINKNPKLKKLSDAFECQTKISTENIVLGVAIVALFMLFSGYGAGMICHLASFAYPFYFTLVTLSQSKKGPASQFWLVYWIVYGFLGVLETILGVFLKQVILYYPFKLLFCLWLYLPQFKGADIVYSKVIVPLFKRHETVIDEALRKIDKAITKEN